MKKIFILAVAGLFLLPSSVVMAKAPFVELASLLYDAESKKQCKTDSIDALKSIGFELKSGTYDETDTVGVYKELKGVISCVDSDNGKIIIIMSGDNYILVIQKLDEAISELQ